jgi:hypothetical protein
VLLSGQYRRGVVRDLSAGGLCVETQVELPPDTRVVVALDLPREDTVFLEGSTRRSRRLPLSLARLAAPELLLDLRDPPAAYLRWLEAVAGEGPA